MQVRILVSIRSGMYIWMYIMRVGMHLCMYACVHVYMCFTCMYHVYIYASCMHICVCMCI